MNISPERLATFSDTRTDGSNHPDENLSHRHWARDIHQIPAADVNAQMPGDNPEGAVSRETGRLIPSGVQLLDRIRVQICDELKDSKKCTVYCTYSGNSKKVDAKARFTRQVRDKLYQEGLADEAANAIQRTIKAKETPALNSPNDYFFFVQSIKINDFLDKYFSDYEGLCGIFEVSRQYEDRKSTRHDYWGEDYWGEEYWGEEYWEEEYAITFSVPEPLVDTRYFYIIPRVENYCPIAMVDKEKYVANGMARYFGDTLSVFWETLNDQSNDDRQKLDNLKALLSPGKAEVRLTAGEFLARISAAPGQGVRITANYCEPTNRLNRIDLNVNELM